MDILNTRQTTFELFELKQFPASERQIMSPLLNWCKVCEYNSHLEPPFCHICLMYHISGRLLFSETVFMAEILQLTFRRSKGNILVNKVTLIYTYFLFFCLIACMFSSFFFFFFICCIELLSMHLKVKQSHLRMEN